MRFSLSLVPLPLHILGSQPQVVREDLKDDLIPAHSRSNKIFFDCSKKIQRILPTKLTQGNSETRNACDKNNSYKVVFFTVPP